MPGIAFGAVSDPVLADRLARRTLELVDVRSESRHEAELAGHVLGVLRDAGVAARDAGDTCVLAGVTARGDRPLVLLAGHLDTVPAQGNWPGRIEDGRVVGLGATDMKGADAVMLELALAGLETTVDVGCVWFGREELPFGDSALTPLLQREPGLATADLVIVMEPTANRLQLGCLELQLLQVGSKTIVLTKKVIDPGIFPLFMLYGRDTGLLKLVKRIITQ